MTGNKFMIGAKIWPGLSKLIEELGDVAQVAGKLIAADGNDIHWEGTNLRERMHEKIADLIAACTFVIEQNGLSSKLISDRVAHKLSLFRQWHTSQESPAPLISNMLPDDMRNPYDPWTIDAPNACTRESKSISVNIKQAVEVKFLRARCGVRYWEDAIVNGVQDEDGSRIPCREGTAFDNDHFGGGNWCPTIVLETGRIEEWPQGTTAQIHYKVCDDGDYKLLNAGRNIVKSINGYVPRILRPKSEYFENDYVIMNIGPDGVIEDWKVELSEFEKDQK